MLATPKTIRTTEDGASFEVDGTWELPRNIPDTLVVECRRWLAAHSDASGIAQEGRVKHWLIRLLGGLPGDYSVEAVQMKMGAFLFALSEYRAYCFDDATLKLAMRRFKFWPSSAELIAFADEMDRWTRQHAARCHKIVDAGPQSAPAETNSAERSIRLNREKQNRERAELAAMLAKKFGAPPPVPQQRSDEDDDSYLARLKDWRERPMKRIPAEAGDNADAESETAET